MDECCRQLVEDQEYSTDSLLVSLVRIRKIAVKVNDALWEAMEVSNDGAHRNFHSIAVASIRKELDAFMQQLPDHLKWNREFLSDHEE